MSGRLLAEAELFSLVGAVPCTVGALTRGPALVTPACPLNRKSQYRLEASGWLAQTARLGPLAFLLSSEVSRLVFVLFAGLVRPGLLRPSSGGGGGAGSEPAATTPKSLTRTESLSLLEGL